MNQSKKAAETLPKIILSLFGGQGLIISYYHIKKQNKIKKIYNNTV